MPPHPSSTSIESDHRAVATCAHGTHLKKSKLKNSNKIRDKSK